MRNFDTAQFRFAHGTSPRGRGRWAFATRADVRSVSGTGQPVPNIVFLDGLFGEVKRLLPAGDWVVLS
jgi:hypothetical protein